MGHEVIVAKNMHRMEGRRLGLALLVGFCIGVLTCFIWMTPSAVEPQLYSGNEVFANSATAETISYLPISERGKETDGHEAEESIQLKTPSIPKSQTVTALEQPGEGRKAPKPICHLSNPRTDVCDMEGDVRVHGKSFSVTLVTDPQSHDPAPQSPSWLIKPYARKFDQSAMSHIRQVTVRSTPNVNESGTRGGCTVNHSVPAVVFAIGGYTGNYYHDFTDVLIPLFITSHQFAGQVQFVIDTKNMWWMSKYETVLKALSRHEIVFFKDDDERVHCYPRAIVGLHSHMPMSIDPARAPNGYSMVDFARLMRATFSLGRQSPIRLGEGDDKEMKKPRLLVIPRQGTRRFTNSEEIVRAAEKEGFEVVTLEAKMGSRVGDTARIVNSCDVMMGVHGAGLSNFVFLPTGAVVIQIVPVGNLETISRSCFGNSTQDAGLHYVEYSISEEESSLIEQYPRDDAVFKDPKSIHRLGWKKMGQVYLDNQDVKLDMVRFRPVLLKAKQLLRRQQQP